MQADKECTFYFYVKHGYTDHNLPRCCFLAENYPVAELMAATIVLNFSKSTRLQLFHSLDDIMSDFNKNLQHFGYLHYHCKIYSHAWHNIWLYNSRKLYEEKHSSNASLDININANKAIKPTSLHYW